MANLSELYHDLIIDHSRSPRNFHRMENATHSAEGHNPLCGDQLTVYLHVEDDVVTDMSFEGQGCAISKASASMMTAHLKGKSREEVESAFETFHTMVTGGGKADIMSRLGKLAVFAGVSQFPVRVKCATLPWHTMRAALAGEKQATTE